MFKKLRLPLLLVLGAALTMLSPSAAQAKRHEHERHHSRFSVYFGVSPRYYAPAPGYYGNGYYDRWGYWHPHHFRHGPYPYGYYDAWGYWHP